MWTVVYGAAGTGKHEIIQTLVKKGFTEMKTDPVPDDHSFASQLSYLTQRIRLHIEIQKIMNKKDIVTLRSVYDTHEVFSRLMLTTERITQPEFDTLEIIYRALYKALEPPHAAVFCHCGTLTAIDRMSLRGKTLPQGEWDQQRLAYKTFSERVKIPQVEVNFSLDMGLIRQEFEFNFASLKTTAVTNQSLWAKEMFHE